MSGRNQAPTAPALFSPALVRARRTRAAQSTGAPVFLADEMADGLADRLALFNRRFASVLALGTTGLPALEPGCFVGLDPSPARAKLFRSANRLGVAADLERLPLAAGQFDLALSSGCLHAVDDLPGVLIQMHHLLKPDAPMLAAFLGGATLQELRLCLTQAEDEQRHGAERRIGPFVDVRDAGALLQRAGFAMPVADIERFTVHYRNPAGLLDDLKAMGETASYAARGRRPLTRQLIARTLALYQERFAADDGTVPATFDILYLCGWARSEGQPEPKRRGSARVSLAEVLEPPKT